ncbi:uncharacterized protein LOC100211789 isoform X1 [Hydra vulgaris]|uniref:Uncharacterized protein LOC100211789 isoform X1 n=1 Tax=Hydra vulgaris TaxID=6087 RepID=A0ABM4D397_HYDVU
MTALSHKVKFNVEVTIDVICPWCYIGKRYLEAAINALENEATFVITWKPFLIDAQCPSEGIPYNTYLISKFGEKIAKQEMKGQGPLGKAGKSVGIKFDPDRYVVNSIKSNLLLQFVLEQYGQEKQSKMHELLCKQYFEESVNLNSDTVLKQLSEEVGIDSVSAAQYFTSPSNVKRLFNDLKKLKKRGIVGVPYFQFSIDGATDIQPVGFSGAQSKAGFIDTITKLLKEYQKGTKPKQ